MVVYNVTCNLETSLAPEWLEWMKGEHLPEVMATGCFVESRISRVHGEEDGGVTYAITYLSPSQEHMDTYSQTHAPLLQRDHSARFAGKFAAFRTVLSVIEEFKS